MALGDWWMAVWMAAEALSPTPLRPVRTIIRQLRERTSDANSEAAALSDAKKGLSRPAAPYSPFWARTHSPAFRRAGCMLALHLICIYLPAQSRQLLRLVL